MAEVGTVTSLILCLSSRLARVEAERAQVTSEADQVRRHPNFCPVDRQMSSNRTKM